MAESVDAGAVRAEVDQFRVSIATLKTEIGKTIVGNEPVIDGVLMCLLGGGHALLEGVPGLGKTMLVRTLAEALSLAFSRVQFTPDLMPADILGTTVIDETQAGGKVFEFRKGPIFANIVLADENQPRHAEDAVGAPRGDAGASRHRRPSHPRARGAVRRPRDAEPARVRRYVSTS